MPPTQPSGILDGVRILELARWQAAPRGGMILRDMGAEVIKLEWSKSSDLRNSGPFVGEMSVQFAAYNRGKKSVTLNTRHPEGKELCFKLLEGSDVVLENFRPGTMEKMGSATRRCARSTQASSSPRCPVSASTDLIETGSVLTQSSRQ